jgi:hypothetical protein
MMVMADKDSMRTTGLGTTFGYLWWYGTYRNIPPNIAILIAAKTTPC